MLIGQTTSSLESQYLQIISHLQGPFIMERKEIGSELAADSGVPTGCFKEQCLIFTIANSFFFFLNLMAEIHCYLD